MDYTSARLNMVESQVRTNDVTDIGIQLAMRAIPREKFVLPARSALAYADVEVEYSPDRWMMRPRDVAKLLHTLRPHAGERALAICAPYAAAVLARMGLSVIRDRRRLGRRSRPIGS
jgi:protein-L-isoaspartate(D-aspartate) O-methyltransferase